MKDKHLNDAEIQQYILQKNILDVDIIEHIRHCPYCKTKAGQYSLLFDGIKQQEKPVFDFNLAGLVIEQLPQSKPGVSFGYSLFYLIVFIAFFSILTVFYLFGNNLLILMRGVTPILIGLIITTVSSLLVFLCIDMYRKYQTQIKALNVH